MNYDLDRLAVELLAEKARTNYVWIDGVFLPQEYKRIADAVENFEVKDDDVWVCSFQKSGTTWTQEMVWNITHDLDSESNKIEMNARFPFLEFTGTITAARMALRESVQDVPTWMINSVEYCDNLTERPRHIKCHLPFNLLPKQIRTGAKQPKIIYVARNPKDVCVSFYHHSKLLEGYTGDFQQFCELFLGDRVNYATYWNHVLGFWEKKKTMRNILFITFEEMKADLSSVVKKTASFLNKNLTDDQVKKMIERLSFANMKDNPAVNKVNTLKKLQEMKVFGDKTHDGNFIRNGNVGQWKETMSESMVKRFDDWIVKNTKNTDYKV